MAEEIHVKTDKARSGETPHIVRYVLGISVVLAAMAMTVIWVTGALTSDQKDGDIGTARPAAETSAVPQSSDRLINGSAATPASAENQRSTVSADE